MNGNTHTVIVLEKKEDSVIIAEGNYNGAIHWDRELDRDLPCPRGQGQGGDHLPQVRGEDHREELIL